MENAGTAQRELIEEERFCIGCGYNLRMLHWTGKCPECGRDVLDSMGRNLFSADRDWLKCVRRGMILLSLHMAAGVGVALTRSYGPSLMLLYVLVPIGPKTGMLIDLTARGISASVMGILSLLLYGAGTWFFTRTDVSETVASSQTNTGLRWIAMLWIALGLLSLSCAYFRLHMVDGVLLMMGALVAEVLLIILFYARLANLAEMAQAPRLGTRTRWMIAIHLLTVMTVMTCFMVDRLIATILLGLLASAGLILWMIYFQLLSKALRRS